MRAEVSRPRIYPSPKTHSSSTPPTLIKDASGVGITGRDGDDSWLPAPLPLGELCLIWNSVNIELLEVRATALARSEQKILRGGVIKYRWRHQASAWSRGSCCRVEA
ncbi:hypothetical protein BaRGS_00003716 [Batillaria attramentaria]|uniref:Uncharacterized protein n=1 Tax=Batillaria attramentaria TaxID=370345 RepID=A0ABD0M0X7_9CAEN